MPPKKKGAAAKVKPKTPAALTRSSVPETVTNSRGKEYETTAALARPRRESAILPSPVVVNKTATAAKKTATTTPAKKRGRPAKATVDEEPPRKRGRPATKKVAVVATDEDAEDDEDEEPDNQEVATPRRRGRPPKKETANNTKATVTKAAPKPSAKRGRPSKADIAAAQDDVEEGAEESAEDDAPPPNKRRRSRPPKVVKDAVPEEETPPPKKRGSSPRGGETTKIPGDGDAAADQLEEDLVDTAEQVEGKPSTARGNGRRKGAKGKGKTVKADMPMHDEEVDPDEELEKASSGKRYWLMKAEQEDREETLANGGVFNTKFTIDDLKSKGGPEPWDGVRNPAAAKNMRTMKKGDLAFFYASGGKSGRKPGIVGIMEVVKEHEPDQTAWDEGAYGYVKDEKSRGKWCVVHVEYRNKLSSPVHLSELQKYMQGSGVLSKMQVLKQSRLSVTSVSEKEWNFVIDNLVDGFEEEESNALPEAEGSLTNDTSKGTINAEEESTLITTEQPKSEVVINESSQQEFDLEPGTALAGLALPTTEGEIPSTDTIFPAETSQTSRAGSVKATSRGGSRAPSINAAAPTSRQSSRTSSVVAGSLAPPTTNSRGRSRTPKVRAGSAAPTNAEQVNGAAGMQTIGEDDE